MRNCSKRRLKDRGKYRRKASSLGDMLVLVSRPLGRQHRRQWQVRTNLAIAAQVPTLFSLIAHPPSSSLLKTPMMTTPCISTTMAPHPHSRPKTQAMTNSLTTAIELSKLSNLQRYCLHLHPTLWETDSCMKAIKWSSLCAWSREDYWAIKRLLLRMMGLLHLVGIGNLESANSQSTNACLKKHSKVKNARW